jgi:glycosyltransferase involved in cell wall biosynthesis
MEKELILIGTTWPFRSGGIASFNERLARQFQQQGFKVTIYTFSLQYPSFLFPGKSQYSKDPAPTDLTIHVRINSINPFNWIWMGFKIAQLKAPLVLVRFWLPFMGPCLGTILRIIKWNGVSKVVCIADNIIPHEKRFGDYWFTKYFIGAVDGFITMSKKVQQDLSSFTQKKGITCPHPLYDSFGTIMSKEAARKQLGLPLNENIILFFGFIRKYKGLDLLLEAMKIVASKNEESNKAPIKLLIAGEFYEGEETYKALIDSLGIQHLIYSHTKFIPQDQVQYYLNACDFVIQPYRNATQSGVTPLAYHFEKPMLVTNVGALPDMIEADQSGLVANPTPESIAAQIEQLYLLGEDYFLPHLRR